MRRLTLFFVCTLLLGGSAGCSVVEGAAAALPGVVQGGIAVWEMIAPLWQSEDEKDTE